MAEIIHKVHRGRHRTIDPAVLTWSKRRKRYEASKSLVYRHLLRHFGNDLAHIKVWFHTPNLMLSNKPPKDLLNPINISRLLRLVRKPAI